MHNAAFKYLSLEANYEAVDVTSENLADMVQSLRDENIYGANVTIPHKLAVMPMMDRLSKAAKTIGAVNTIVNQGGELVGHNTDAAGFLQGLEDERVYLRKKVAVMLGAGGAARAIAYALLNSGVAKLWIYNRTPEKAAVLVKEFAKVGSAAVLKEEELPFIIRQAEILVNTTSVGMEHGGVVPDESPLPDGLLPKQGFVCDIIYRPARTKLLYDARDANLKTQNGLSMLVYQGAEAFRLWTGQEAPAHVMMEAAKSVLQKSEEEKKKLVVKS